MQSMPESLDLPCIFHITTSSNKWFLLAFLYHGYSYFTSCDRQLIITGIENETKRNETEVTSTVPHLTATGFSYTAYTSVYKGFISSLQNCEFCDLERIRAKRTFLDLKRD